MKWSDKKGIQHLVTLCKEKGVNHVVLSPGSRNAPLTISFNRLADVKTYVIPDERVAAFTALGMAQQSGKTVALVCTSGSAMLNYAPAIAEAFYSHIPLLIISADRPAYWIHQREGQAIDQKEIYQNYIKASFQLPLSVSSEQELWHHDRIINEAINSTQSGQKGPVHINVPLEEPLYQLEEQTEVKPKIIESPTVLFTLKKDNWQSLQQEINIYQKIMILSGQYHAPEWLKEVEALGKDRRVVVLSECTSNVLGENIVGCIDRNIISLDDKQWESFSPQLLITMGGAIVSKKIKQKLRALDNLDHWHVHPTDEVIDTFQAITKMLPVTPLEFFNKIEFDSSEAFGSTWQKHNIATRKAHDVVMKTIPFSDLKAMEIILDNVPQGSQVQLGNSTIVRYAQLFEHRADVDFYANRGVSGIDGSTSTAIGAALAIERTVTHLSGDMSFFYDSNAFWHQHIPDNFRCIVINNGGGGIFRIIDGPNGVEELETFFEVNQPNSVEHIAQAYGVDFLMADDADSLTLQLKKMYQEQNKPCILEVITPREDNDTILKKYFEKLKNLKDEY